MISRILRTITGVLSFDHSIADGHLTRCFDHCNAQTVMCECHVSSHMWMPLTFSFTALYALINAIREPDHERLVWDVMQDSNS